MAGSEGPAKVTLHIYNAGTSGLVKGLNSVLRPLGTGAFHCGVEVYDLEWSYSDTSFFSDDPEATGVFFSWPRKCEGHSYSESISLGSTLVSESAVMKLIESFEQTWKGEEYDILEHNCCHFCKELCKMLGVERIPPWVMNLAGAGATLSTGVNDLAKYRTKVAYMIADALQAMCFFSCCLTDSGAAISVEQIHADDAEGQAVTIGRVQGRPYNTAGMRVVSL